MSKRRSRVTNFETVERVRAPVAPVRLAPRFECALCPKAFRSLDALAAHRASHDAEVTRP